MNDKSTTHNMGGADSKKENRMSDKIIHRGETMLISIDAPTEYPVTTLQQKGIIL